MCNEQYIIMKRLEVNQKDQGWLSHFLVQLMFLRVGFLYRQIPSNFDNQQVFIHHLTIIAKKQFTFVCCHATVYGVNCHNGTCH